MKKMKRIMSLLLAVMLVLGMSMTAFADEDTSVEYFDIVAPAKEGENNHTYDVYQIFYGDVTFETISAEKDGEDDRVVKVLSNVKWGFSSKDEDKVGKAVDKNTLLQLENLNGSDKENNAVIESYINFDKPIITFESGDRERVQAGYYLIKDRDGSLDNFTDESYTLNIVEIVGPVTIKLKAAKPTVDKQVYDEEDDWGEAADHKINESFQFKLIATVPADGDLKAYDSYKLRFRDSMSAGITFESIYSVEAIVFEDDDDKTGTTIKIDDSEYKPSEITVEESGKSSWNLTVYDLKKIVGDAFGEKKIEVVVIYNAHLNEKAFKFQSNASVNKDNGNYNEVYLEYSNNPNSQGTGETDEDDEMGKTTTDIVWVFTYEVSNKKLDGSETVSGSDEHPQLSGAGFKLFKDADIEEEKTVYSNPIIMRKILVADDRDVTGDDVDSDIVVYYVPAKDGQGGVEEMFSQEDGTFDIRGLEDGTYYLVETTTPAGYNTCDPIVITIKSGHVEDKDGMGAGLTLERNEDSNTNILDNEIYNYKGTLLPRTGGIGTKIFYVVGGILVIGCGVILVTRKLIRK